MQICYRDLASNYQGSVHAEFHDPGMKTIHNPMAFEDVQDTAFNDMNVKSLKPA